MFFPDVTFASLSSFVRKYIRLVDFTPESYQLDSVDKQGQTQANLDKCLSYTALHF